MSFVPTMVSPEYSIVKTRQDFSHLRVLSYPRDRARIAALPLAEKQIWYAAQDPQKLIDYGINDDFGHWWFWHYIWPLKVKRAIFRFKFW